MWLKRCCAMAAIVLLLFSVSLQPCYAEATDTGSPLYLYINPNSAAYDPITECTAYDPAVINPISPKDIYHFNFPERSAIFIDEVSLIWDNRNFKNMDPKVVEWFRYQRHHKCRVYLFSQSFDIDKKLRDLCDEMYIVGKFARVLVRAKRIIRKPVVVHPSPEAPARIDEDLIVDGPLMAFFGGRIYAWIPYWAKTFNSFKKV